MVSWSKPGVTVHLPASWHFTQSALLPSAPRWMSSWQSVQPVSRPVHPVPVFRAVSREAGETCSFVTWHSSHLSSAWDCSSSHPARRWSKRSALPSGHFTIGKSRPAWSGWQEAQVAALVARPPWNPRFRSASQPMSLWQLRQRSFIPALPPP